MKRTAWYALNGVPPPLKVIPAFQPLPFKHDKFLAIKSRSADKWVDSCNDILSRSCALNQKVSEYFNLHHVPPITAAPVKGNVSESEGYTKPNAAPSHVEALPSYLIEELHQINKKAQRLTTIQGFVLSDRLVFDMFHINVMNGDYNTALTLWLRSHILGDEQRGPPYPLWLLQDLVSILGVHLMSSLPDSAANFHMLSAFPSGRNLGGLGADKETLRTLLEHEWRPPQPQRWDDDVGQTNGRSADDEADWEAPLLYTNSSNRYTRHYLIHYFLPVWRAAGKMGLFFDDLRENARLSLAESPEEAADGKMDPVNGMARGRVGDILPSVKTQNAVVRQLLMSFIPVQFPSPREADADAVWMPLRVLTELLIALAACAAEAKEPWLLLSLQTTFCTAFLTRSDDAEAAGRLNGGRVGLNTEAWIGYLEELGPDVSAALVSQVHDLLERFSLDIISLVNYGRQAFRSEQQLWAAYDALRLMATATRHYQSRDTARNEKGTAFRYSEEFFNRLSRILRATSPVGTPLDDEVVNPDDASHPQAQAHLWGETSALVSSYIRGLSPVSEAVAQAILYVGYACQDPSLIPDEENFPPNVFMAARPERMRGKDAACGEGARWSLLERTLLLRNIQHQQRLALGCLMNVEDHHDDGNSGVETENGFDFGLEAGARSPGWLEELMTGLKIQRDRGVFGQAGGGALPTVDFARIRPIVDSLAERLVCLTLIDVVEWWRTTDERLGHYRDGSTCEGTTPYHTPQAQFEDQRVKGMDDGHPSLSPEDNNEAHDANGDYERGASDGAPSLVDHNEDGPTEEAPNAEDADAAMWFESLQELQVPKTLQRRVDELFAALKLAVGNPLEGKTPSWCSCVSPAAASVLAVLLAGFPTNGLGHLEDEQEIVDGIWGDLVDIATYHLSFLHTSAINVTEDNMETEVASPLSGLFGNSISILLLMLARTAQWDLAERLLCRLEAYDGEHSQPPNSDGPMSDDGVWWLWSGVTMDPEIFSEVFSRAREDGATVVCAMLSPKRKQLFF
ncbi:unnamed protein product [Phytomonas sp. Hart1]|nr:unnamed protein product [Phytomonas sp. Hart1]|eukprot:CCW69220.1 unnamed protein product [Phytomonas sp. isolate Hart1]